MAFIQVLVIQLHKIFICIQDNVHSLALLTFTVIIFFLLLFICSVLQHLCLQLITDSFGFWSPTFYQMRFLVQEPLSRLLYSLLDSHWLLQTTICQRRAHPGPAGVLYLQHVALLHLLWSRASNKKQELPEIFR